MQLCQQSITIHAWQIEEGLICEGSVLWQANKHYSAAVYQLHRQGPTAL